MLCRDCSPCRDCTHPQRFLTLQRLLVLQPHPTARSAGNAHSYSVYVKHRSQSAPSSLKENMFTGLANGESQNRLNHIITGSRFRPWEKYLDVYCKLKCSSSYINCVEFPTEIIYKSKSPSCANHAPQIDSTHLQ